MDGLSLFSKNLRMIIAKRYMAKTKTYGYSGVSSEGTQATLTLCMELAVTFLLPLL